MTLSLRRQGGRCPGRPYNGRMRAFESPDFGASAQTKFMKHAVTVLVVSCDQYADAWELFFRLFWKHWPDCPYPVCLGTNYLTYSDGRVRCIPVGEDRNWSSNLLIMLERIPSPYVLLCLDDYFLLKRIDTTSIQRCFDILEALKGGQVLISKVPKTQQTVGGYPEIGEIRPGTPYRTSLNVGCWRKVILQELAREGESPWEFEINGTQRSNAYPGGFYASRKNLYHLNAHVHIRRGIWLRRCLKIARQMNIKLDLAHRPVMSPLEHSLYLASQMKARVWDLLLNWRHHR